ncbi:MAG: hypothetical protein ACM31O_03495 [Bacteroidota bacterium]
MLRKIDDFMVDRIYQPIVGLCSRHLRISRRMLALGALLFFYVYQADLLLHGSLSGLSYAFVTLVLIGMPLCFIGVHAATEPGQSQPNRVRKGEEETMCRVIWIVIAGPLLPGDLLRALGVLGIMSTMYFVACNDAASDVEQEESSKARRDGPDARSDMSTPAIDRADDRQSKE